MGSEILDSSRGTRSVAPSPPLDAAESVVPMVELDELKPVRPDNEGVTKERRPGLVTYLRGLREDPPRRRTTIRMVAVCVLLVVLTASVVQFRAQRQVSAEQSGRLAVDVRLDEVRPASRSFDLNGSPANGSVTARIEMHNVGPAEVRLVGLDVTQGGEVQVVNDVRDTSTTLDPGRTSDTTYNIRLPCVAGAQRTFGSPELTARVMTTDRQVHDVPVNMSQVNQDGGLLVACIASDDDQTRPINNYSSTTDGTSVAIKIITNFSGQQVALHVPDVGVQLRFTSVPALPATTRAGIELAIKVTPSVVRCPRGTINFDALQGIGVTIGTEQLSDSYLPALVAQAFGRACGQRR